jgi:TonB-dependent SusC/RagA subfamily outer membrane receptor
MTSIRAPRTLAVVPAVVLAAGLAAGLAGCASTPSAAPTRAVVPERPVAHAAELLRHHAGVRLVESRAGIRLFVRGALDEPLVVLDGMPLPPDPRGVLSIVDPRDVAAIRVLTGPAELTYYGARGTNGVVVVTTKRGR